LLLVDFVKPPFGRFVDFCAGCGVVGLGMLTRDAEARAVLVEIQERLATLARRNADENGMGERVEVRHEDLRGPLRDTLKFAVAVANPPYRSLDEGPASPDPEVATAQHEIEVKLDELCDKMRRSLFPAGRAALVYPAARVGHLLSSLEGAGLRPVRARFVHPRANEPANRVLVEANKGARGPLVVEPPLVLRDGDGYSAEAARLLGDG
jgi:tRNA1Val (adenine37-N6)-methyltransferase